MIRALLLAGVGIGLGILATQNQLHAQGFEFLSCGRGGCTPPGPLPWCYNVRGIYACMVRSEPSFDPKLPNDWQCFQAVKGADEEVRGLYPQLKSACPEKP